MNPCWPLLAFLALLGWTALVWLLGRADGRTDAEEKRLLEDFDRVIEKVRQRLGAEKP